MQYKAAIFSILAMLAVVEDVKCADDNDNIKHFRALCYLVRLTQSQMPKPSDGTDTTRNLEEILKLNMSVADKSWREMFDGDADAKEWTKVEATITDSNAKKDWPNKWQKWLETRHKMKQETGAGTWESQHPIPKDLFQQQQAREHLKRISEAATTAAEKLTNIESEQNKTDIEGIRDSLKKALCGNNVEDSQGTITCKGGETSKFDEETSCKDVQAGTSLANDLSCVCAQTANAVCSDQIKGKLNGNELADGALQDIIKACPKLTDEPKNIAEAIEAATQAINSLLALEHKTGKVFLGKDSDGNCNTAAVSCVNYGKYCGSAHFGFESIPWVKALRQAQQHYRDYLRKEDKKDLAAAKVAQMRVAAEAAYSAAQIALPLQQNTAGQQGTGTPEMTKQTKCKLKNSTAEECPSQHCDYDKEKEECKPKPGSETATAGTGDGTAGANSETKMCSEKTKQEDCKSPDCKWEGETCKDSSFLLTKKFALSVVSAAFVALLF